MLALQAQKQLLGEGVSVEVVDLRVLNPLNVDSIIESVKKTGRLLVLDGGWRNCGLAGEVIAAVLERLPLGVLKTLPRRITLPDAPAPTSRVLEKIYYPGAADVLAATKAMLL